jgi:hypothetical protein
VMARLCCVRALNARTRVREQVRLRGALERGGTRSREAFALERGGTRSRGPLIGPLQWAAGATTAWVAPCVCLGKRCFLLLFFAGFKQDSPGFLGDPQGCPRHIH